MDGFLVAFVVGLCGGLANLLVDVPALWNHDWSHGISGYISGILILILATCATLYILYRRGLLPLPKSAPGPENQRG